MSPTLVNSVIDWILREYHAVQKMVNRVHRFANSVGLRINIAKTKALVNHHR